MPKFILTGVFLLLLALLIQYPYPILEHEYLIEEYQFIPQEVPVQKTLSEEENIINVAVDLEVAKDIDEEDIKINDREESFDFPLNKEAFVDNRQSNTSQQL